MPREQRRELLTRLTPPEQAHLFYDWQGWWARPNQLPPDGDWRVWLVLAGRGFGKTRIGAEWVREQVRSLPLVNMIGATADDARDIMIEGESGILAVCPPWERPLYQPSRRQLSWPNGAKTLIFTADEPERLRGKQHMAIWADEVAAWRYPEAWDQAMLGLRLGPDPRVVATTTPKPTRLIRDLVESPTCVVTKGSTYDNVENLAPAFAEEIIQKYEGTRLGRQELHAELLLDEGMAFPEFNEHIHVIRPFTVPDEWDRLEFMDHGKNIATAWYVAATDFEGNTVVLDEYYAPGLVSEHAEQIWRRRKGEDYSPAWWARDRNNALSYVSCFADPSIRNNYGTRDWKGRELSVEVEYGDHGIGFSPGQNDRRAGYVRIAEMLKVDQDRHRPDWAPLDDAVGSPRLFIVGDRCPYLVEQLRDAPVEEEGKPLAGEAIGKDWEGAHGHAIAALRYGMMSRPQPTRKPVERDEDGDYDPRREAHRQGLKAREDDEYWERDADRSYAETY